MMGAEIHCRRRVGDALLLQLVLVEQCHVPRPVIEDGSPFTADVQVHRALAGKVQTQLFHRAFHLVEVVAVGLQVYAAVKHVDGISIAGDCYREAAVLGGVNASGPRAQVKSVLFDVPVLEVDHRHHAGLAVADEQTANDRLCALAAMVVKDFSLANEINGVHGVPERHDGVVVPGGVLHQLLQPGSLEGQADAENHVGVSYPSNVPGSGLVGMRISIGWQQRKDLHAVPPDCAQPVGHYVAGGNQPDFCLSCGSCAGPTGLRPRLRASGCGSCGWRRRCCPFLFSCRCRSGSRSRTAGCGARGRCRRLRRCFLGGVATAGHRENKEQCQCKYSEQG